MLIKVLADASSDFHILPTINRSNHWIYNIETVLEFYFFSYFFYSILKSSFNRKLIKLFTIIYPIILIISFFTIQKYYIFHTYTYTLGELYLIILCLFYYSELYTDSEFKKLSTLPEFWIVTGLFIFCVGEFPYMILINYLNNYHRGISVFFSDYILGSLSFLMYIMFTIGLLWKVRIQKSL